MRPGTDRFHVNVNSFNPRLHFTTGGIDGVEAWEPNFGVSGPIVKGRLWFTEGADYRYVRNYYDTVAGPQANKYTRRALVDLARPVADAESSRQRLGRRRSADDRPRERRPVHAGGVGAGAPPRRTARRDHRPTRPRRRHDARVEPAGREPADARDERGRAAVRGRPRRHERRLFQPAGSDRVARRAVGNLHARLRARRLAAPRQSRWARRVARVRRRQRERARVGASLGRHARARHRFLRQPASGRARVRVGALPAGHVDAASGRFGRGGRAVRRGDARRRAVSSRRGWASRGRSTTRRRSARARACSPTR